MNDLSLVGLYVGLFVGLIFLIYTLLKYKKAPEYLHVAVIILSCAGIVMGLHLGYLALTVQERDLGQIASHRIPIVLGALAVIWTAIDSVVKTFKQSLRE
jgi:hypothetical protein